MTETKTKRRGHGDDSIFFSAERNRYIGDISVGFRADDRRIRRRVSGHSKQEVRKKASDALAGGGSSEADDAELAAARRIADVIPTGSLPGFAYLRW